MLLTGNAYLFHTPLGIWLGRIVESDLDAIKLETCSWIPDQGRMHECVKNGTFNECEPVGNGVVLTRGSIAIAIPWLHSLPTVAK